MTIFVPQWERFKDKKPAGPVELDRTHELARGLTFATVLNGDREELVNGRRLKLFADAHIDDEGVSFDEADDYLKVDDVVLDSSFTISLRPNFHDLDGNGFQYFVSTDGYNTPNSINVWISEGSGILSAKVGTGGNINATSAYYPDDNDKGLSITVDGTAINGYVKGVSVLSGTSGAIANGTTKGLWLGSRADLNAGRFFGGKLPYAYIHDHAVGEDEQKALHENPYQILKPRRKMFAVESGVAPPSVGIQVLRRRIEGSSNVFR